MFKRLNFGFLAIEKQFRVTIQVYILRGYVILYGIMFGSIWNRVNMA